MFDINLAEKSYKISFKTLPLKIQWSKGRQRGTVCLPRQLGLIGLMLPYQIDLHHTHEFIYYYFSMLLIYF